MHGLKTCLLKCMTVAEFHIYAQCVEDVAKSGGWRPCIKVMEITLLIMEKHGKIMEFCFFYFCGNPGMIGCSLSVQQNVNKNCVNESAYKYLSRDM